MSLLFGPRGQRDLGDTSSQLVPPRAKSIGSVTVSADSALRHSAVWACLRLRADLLSTMPIEVYRDVAGVQVISPSTPFLLDPGNDGYGAPDWLYSSQVDLDRAGNCFGIVTAVDGFGLPAAVELQPLEQVRVRGKGPRITGFTIGGKKYEPGQVWHERQFTIPGVPLGLSPIAYAAMSIGNYLSAQQFGIDWFTNGAVPAGRLKNVNKTINAKEAQTVKERFKAAVSARDIFVHGADWEYDANEVTANESQFLETMQFGITDIARFMGIPADLIEAESSSSAKITYANITQRHLQLLIINLGPTVIRREWRLSKALPKPRQVKFNTDSLLRMDPQTLASVLNSKVTARVLAPSEARAADNRLPFTEDQYAEFDRLFGSKQPIPGSKSTVPDAGGVTS